MKRELAPVWRHVSSIVGLAIAGLSVNYIFNLGLFGVTMQENSYLYLLLALSLFQVFLFYPLTPSLRQATMLPDLVLGVVGFAGCAYFAWYGLTITAEGWMLMPPNQFVVGLSILLCLLILEALRRVAGWSITIVCTVFLLFPVVADRMPEILYGNQFSFSDAMTMHILDSQGLVGIPLRVTGTLLIGFIIFGVVLSQTGGAKFFLDTAGAIMGRQRGGAGKIAVIASALFGSMSGSSISNVITTGAVTIPAMKQTGFRPSIAGAIEACASTGGIIMPPVMGAVAFLMAQFLNISYFDVVVAALVPSILYYVGLVVLLDIYAARYGIEGVPSDKIASARTILSEGWPFVGALACLIYFLYLRLEAMAPFAAFSFILIVLLLLRRIGVKDLWSLLAELSASVSELIVTLGAVGFIIGAMSMTGVGTALSGELVQLAGNNPYILLLMGAITCFILGMGLTASACYIFLAVILAPALVAQGFNEIAVHLFILYWAIVSNITPPVALACFPAARIAGASYFEVCFMAVMFGFAFYIVPFAFVWNPALVLQTGGILQVPYLIAALAGVVIAAYGIGRYIPRIGPITPLVSVVVVTCGTIICAARGFDTKLYALVVLAALFALVRVTGFGQSRYTSFSRKATEAAK